MKNLLSLTGLKIAIFIGVCHFRMGGTSMTVKIIKSYFVLENEVMDDLGLFFSNRRHGASNLLSNVNSKLETN